ncbi:MAG TPA: MBL fold metallo-hydrolase [Azospirillaceae bacterium]|nr:MBL fold metallo-hydrolase [Azospirillaceae bacterium]
MRVTILGCGGSTGVPAVGNRWGACDRANPRNRRRRASVLVEEDDAVILVDTSPDLREQLLDAEVNHIDAVLWTHVHADHTHGLDDLREICRLMQRPIEVFGDADTLGQLARRFDYAFKSFDSQAQFPFYRPVLLSHEVTGPFFVRGVEVVPFDQDHGYLKTLGFRFGRFAYSTDVLRLDDAAFAALAGIDTWVVDCTRETPHPVHAHLELTLSWIERLKPRRAILTHMNIDLDYDALRRKLPPGVEPGYDGLVLDIPS